MNESPYLMKIKGVLAAISCLILSASLPAFNMQTEQGTLSIYFMNEQVGYEEFEWRHTGRGYELEVSGRMTKPIPIRIDQMIIQLNESYIPTGFSFEGTISGMKQKVKSVISDGHVENVIHISGQEQTSSADIRRDAFLLPNPVFSAYMAITKKFRCSLKEEKQLSAYYIPQVEVPFLLNADENNSCLLLMDISSSVIELATNPDGDLLEVNIPGQNLVARLD
jgi:hypothetical protein